MRYMFWITGFAIIVSIAAVRSAAQPAGAQPAGEKGKEAPPVQELLEDDNEAVARLLNNDGNIDNTQIRADYRDYFSGVSSMRVTPFQRFSARINGWGFQIAEKPGPGQYRYLRFAWKRVGGEGIMIQINSNGSWNQRYFAGSVSQATTGWGAMKRLSEKVPREWEVVTCDLFKDWGPIVVNGLALTPMDAGEGGLFDHFYLGRTVEDLDRATAEMRGKNALKDALPREKLEELWQDLNLRDVKKAGAAARVLTQARKESVPFLREKLKTPPANADDKRILRLIAELDDDEFELREQAYRELDKLGEAAIKHLQKAKEAGSPEAKKRIEALLRSRGIGEGDVTPSQLRLIRVIHILECSATPEARELLEELAKASLEIGLNQDARRALDRMEKEK